MLKLREIRLEKGLSVPELSRRSGVSRRTIEDIEARGDCRISTARLSGRHFPRRTNKIANTKAACSFGQAAFL